MQKEKTIDQLIEPIEIALLNNLEDRKPFGVLVEQTEVAAEVQSSLFLGALLKFCEAN